MRKTPLYIFILFTMSFFCSSRVYAAEGLEKMFIDGNSYYKTGDYDKAINEYENILNKGYENANLYYNLGNAYFRSGDLGRAIVNYERAGRLDPGDSDIKANMKYALSNARTPFVQDKSFWAWGPLKDYRDSSTVDEMVMISSALYVISSILLIISIFAGNNTRRFIVVGVLVLALAFCNGFLAYDRMKESGSRAVVVNSNVNSYYGPFDSATVFFKLHKGMDVNVVKKQGEWYRIKREDGKAGWVRKDDIVMI